MIMISSRSSQGRASRPPPSREVEYKLIQDTVNDVCAAIKKYALKYFTNNSIDYKACLTCFKDLAKLWNMNDSAFTSWKEFTERVNNNSTDIKLQSNEIFKVLMNICDRSMEFEVMIPYVRQRIVTLLKEHVYKYCHSFVEETGGVQVPVVMDYEQHIKTCTKNIETYIDSINADILRYSDMKSSFEKFIAEGRNIGKLMEGICVQIVEISQLIKKWINYDASYPEKLQQEILFNTGYKDTLQEDVIKLHKRRSSLERSLERRAKTSKKLEKEYTEYRKEKKKRKESIHILEMKIEKLEFQIAQKNESVEGTKTALSSKRIVSPRQEEELRAQISRHLKEIDSLNDWLKVTVRQKHRLQKGLKETSDRTYETKIELITNKHEMEEMQRSFEGMNIEIKSMHERLDNLDRKTAVMKHIRIIKMSPETLRKLYRRRREFYQQGQFIEACRYVAQEIAGEWKQLYECLQFEPQRDPDKLSHDIELIDIISARRDMTLEEQALKSLEKWRTYSRKNADVARLIRGLRRLNKEDLADNVEMRFSVESVYG